MRKLLLISVVSSLILSSCVCHNLGLTAGLNMASINGDDTDNYSARSGMFFGGIAELCATNNFAIQPELLYSMQGAEYTQSDGTNGKLKLDYINLPIMAKFKLVDDLYVQGGPQIGFLISAKNEFNSSSDSGNEDIIDRMNSLDLSANIGLAYQLDNGLIFGARYNYGLSNINDISGSDINNQNGVFQFSVGFKFQ